MSGKPDILGVLTHDPTWLAQRLDLGRQAILFIEMTRADYRAQSFLDDRILTPRTRGAWIAFERVKQALESASAAAPLHFIFHSGHVGSTLLSRALETIPGVLALREPLPLRTLAEMHDEAAPDFEEHLRAQITLWRRGYADTAAVVLKATSSAARIGAELMAAHAPARAIYLNLRPEPYLAVLLAGANTPLDLEGMRAERARRLERMLGRTPTAPTSIGELAALTWLAERLTQARLVAAMGARLLSLDFDDFLARPGEAAIACARHLGLAFDPAAFARLEASPLMRAYSKAPEYAYSPALRAEIMAQSRVENAAEIRRGLAWLEARAAEHAGIAALLGGGAGA